MKRFTFFCFQYTKLTCNAKITKLFRNIEKRNTQFDNQNLKEYFFIMFSFYRNMYRIFNRKML